METFSRDQLATMYFEGLEYELYPVQEEALLTWFTSEQGVLVCAPTGTGKTLIAEAAMFEALHSGKQAYYTTPLIALSEQKFDEMRDRAIQWGFGESKVGLVTGNRRVNPEAPILVVVAEILFNRLLHREAFDFADTTAVVMDEFHSFNDPERGIVWEFSLGLLPKHVRLLLLSATVGNAYEFVSWLRNRHDRKVELVNSSDRKIPLTFQWVGDSLLNEHIESMVDANEAARKTPALIFCFNREECWSVAEQLKGKKLLHAGQQADLVRQLDEHEWSEGAGPKLRQILLRGVGVHHAGVLPKYRRIVEDLFQQKLLSVCVCTETLAAGINLPARSVVVPCLVKGPPDKKRIIEPSAAHQMFGRAGRPQFDTEGNVFVLAHEDDVKMSRWREKYDAIPDDTKDPGLRKAKKSLKKKMPKRRTNQTYWTEDQFNKLRDATPAKLESRGQLPWRLLAYMLDISPELVLLRELVGKRLLDSKKLENAQLDLDRMLLTLWRAGYVTLDPEPPKNDEQSSELIATPKKNDEQTDEYNVYRPAFAYPTESMDKLLSFRGVNPLYGVFLINQLGIADRYERIQAMESVLEMPSSVAHHVRVPKHEELPPGPLAMTRLDVQLLKLGIVTPEQLGAVEKDDEKQDTFFEEERVWVLTLADKLKMQFDYDFPGVHGVRIQPVWSAGELIEFGGDFNQYITSKGLQKQEGMIFRHLLRLILLISEFRQLCPPDTTDEEWQTDLSDVSERLANSCRAVDPLSTDKTLEEASQGPDLETESPNLK